jgi:SNF2 family DNA or RNA helicase
MRVAPPGTYATDGDLTKVAARASGYREGGSFTHEGIEYDLDAALAAAGRRRRVKVADLAWVAPFTKTDRRRVEAADLRAPLLVSTTEDGRLVPVDGAHRLQRALEKGRKYLPSRFVRREDLTKVARVGHWRRLDPGESGKDESGNEVEGKTWVRGNLLPSVKPYAHQTEALDTIKTLKPGRGLILAHGTGTGKTPSAVMAVEQQRGMQGQSRALVVAPAGLRENFHAEGVQRFTTSSSQIVSQPGQVKPGTDYTIVSYAAFRENPQGFIDAVKPTIVVADEFHRVSNPESKGFKAFEAVRDQIPRFVGLTASIAQNDPADMAPLLALARGEPIDRKRFRQLHVRDVDTGERGMFGGSVKRPVLAEEKALSALVGRSVHYVEDLDADSKPRADVETVEVPMAGEQLRVYRRTMRGIDPRTQQSAVSGLLRGEERTNVLTRLMLARKASNSLHTVTPMSVEEAAEKTPKVRRLLDDTVKHLSETPDGQVIIYTNFVKGGVDVVSAGLRERGIPFGIFAGKSVPGMTEAARQQAVEDYKAGRKKVIIITGAGAEGLSLGNTTAVHMLDGSYNPERNAQAQARGVRAGGLSHRPPEERRVQIRRYVSTVPKGFWRTLTFQKPSESVDQFVYNVAARKASANRDLRAVLERRSQHEARDRNSTLHRLLAPEPS